MSRKTNVLRFGQDDEIRLTWCSRWRRFRVTYEGTPLLAADGAWDLKHGLRAPLPHDRERSLEVRLESRFPRPRLGVWIDGIRQWSPEAENERRVELAWGVAALIGIVALTAGASLLASHFVSARWGWMLIACGIAHLFLGALGARRIPWALVGALALLASNTLTVALMLSRLGDVVAVLAIAAWPLACLARGVGALVQGRPRRVTASRRPARRPDTWTPAPTA